MTDINGQESSNGQSHHDANGFHAYPINGPTTDGLTKQQLLILQHLQKGESITPWIAKGKYHCESLPGVIHALRKKGWDINTNRRTDKNGKRFPSYRLWSQFQRVEQDAVPGPLFDDGLEDRCMETDSEENEILEEQTGKPTNVEIIRNHLSTEKTISPQTATEKYGLSSSTLRAVISTLRGEKYELPIETVRVPGEEAAYKLLDIPIDITDEFPVPDNGHEGHLETDAGPVIEAVVEEACPVPEKKPVPADLQFAKITGVWKTNGVINLRLAAKEDPEDKPPYKLEVRDAEALVMMLRYHLEGR
jgi:hypothetical protein